MSKRILYIGNDLAHKSNYNSSMETLSELLMKENFKVYKSSSKNNKIIRLLDMCLTVIKKRNKIDYILIDTFSTINFYYAFIVSQLSRLLGVKYIPILHGGDLPKRIERSSWMSNLIFNYSYKNIAPSNYLKTEFEKKGYETLFVPNVLEIEKYKYRNKKNHQPKLLWVRAFRHLYNPKLAIEVLVLLKKTYPEAVLCMVGPIKDTSFEATKELVKLHELEDSVEFTGVLSKEKWHNKSKDFDIFINTTNFDNTPVSVMESMALGLTIVSTNAGGIPYLINNNVEGVLVDKSNPEQMANAIIKLLKENNQELSINARVKAESFSWEIVKETWFSILK